MRDLYAEKLAEFGLTVDDVVATTDGAPVMAKFARIIALIIGLMIHQKCYNHGIHLAVIDTLTTSTSLNEGDEFDSICDDESESDLDQDEEADEADSAYEVIQMPGIPPDQGNLRPSIQTSLDITIKMLFCKNTSKWFITNSWPFCSIAKLDKTAWRSCWIEFCWLLRQLKSH